jgi:hypothetical protein
MKLVPDVLSTALVAAYCTDVRKGENYQFIQAFRQLGRSRCRRDLIMNIETALPILVKPY